MALHAARWWLMLIGLAPNYRVYRVLLAFGDSARFTYLLRVFAFDVLFIRLMDTAQNISRQIRL